MLKQAIDAYNSLLDIVDFFKKPKLQTKSFIFSAVAVVAVAGSLLSAQALSGNGADSHAKSGDSARVLTVEQEASKREAQTSQVDVGQEKANTSQEKTASNEPKSVSSAEKKTAPRPGEPVASKSFQLSVTKNGQYEPGTLIAYDAVKDSKTYYAGDLLVEGGTVTISKSGATTAAVSMRTPDGLAASMPVESTDDSSPYFSIGPDTAQPSESDNSYNMVIELSGSVEPGTYQLHIAAIRSGQSAGAWQYHGFVTVHVVE